jgi:hypothetical protein
MFMHAILPQEWLQVLIDNSVDSIDFLDGHALHRQTMRLKEQGSEAVQNLGPRPSESRTGPSPWAGSTPEEGRPAKAEG